MDEKKTCIQTEKLFAKELEKDPQLVNIVHEADDRGNVALGVKRRQTHNPHAAL